MTARTERRSKQGTQSRQRILDATLELAQELGFGATSIALVCERSGLRPSSVYWHFASKDALVTEVIERSYRRWRTGVERWHAARPARPDLPAELREFVSSVMRGIVHGPEFWRLGLLLGLEPVATEPDARARFVEIRGEVQDFIAAYFLGLLDADPDAATPADRDFARRLSRFTMAANDGLFAAAVLDAHDPEDTAVPLADALIAAFDHHLG